MAEQKTLLWSRIASSKWEDAWLERLQFLGPGRLAIFSLPGSRRIRIEAYALKKREADSLIANFGGQVRRMKHDLALRGDEMAPPLVVRDRLVIVRCARAARAAGKTHPGRPLLVIPAAMAFGTGDHATTATCLRMTCDFAGTRATPWDALDLGTGTGILALAARILGARRCDAWDYDPAAVRAARENARLNRLANVPAMRVDVTKWTPTRQWDLVTANLFSEVLIGAAGEITGAVRPGGSLILSGMLAAQAPGTLAAFRTRGVRFTRVVKRGKWVSALGKC